MIGPRPKDEDDDCHVARQALQRFCPSLASRHSSTERMPGRRSMRIDGVECLAVLNSCVDRISSRSRDVELYYKPGYPTPRYRKTTQVKLLTMTEKMDAVLIVYCAKVGHEEEILEALPRLHSRLALSLMEWCTPFVTLTSFPITGGVEEETDDAALLRRILPPDCIGLLRKSVATFNAICVHFAHSLSENALDRDGMATVAINGALRMHPQRQDKFIESRAKIALSLRQDDGRLGSSCRPNDDDVDNDDKSKQKKRCRLLTPSMSTSSSEPAEASTPANGRRMLLVSDVMRPKSLVFGLVLQFLCVGEVLNFSVTERCAASGVCALAEKMRVDRDRAQVKMSAAAAAGAK